MALFESEIRTVILSNCGLINTMKPGLLERDDTLPAITYTTTSTTRDINHAGKTNYTTKSIQFNVWANTYATAKAACEQVREYLHGLTTTLTTFTLEAAFVSDESDGGVTDFEDSYTRYAIVIEIDVQYH